MKYPLRIIAGLTIAASTAWAIPAWWISRETVNTNLPASDYSAVNAGQLKHFAAKAMDELQANLNGGAGTAVSNVVYAFQNTNNYTAVNLGQLKYVGKPFYDRLIAEGVATNYPWTTNSTADDSDFEAANLGQLKYVFNFDPVDQDFDGMPSSWETANGLNPNNPGDAGTDADGDGLSNFSEYTAGTNPNHVDTDDDGTDDESEALLGWNPTNALAASGLNSNWLYHSHGALAKATWERVPKNWQRYLMVDYAAGTASVHVTLPRNLALTAGGTTQVQVRLSWTTNDINWNETYSEAYFFTNIVLDATNSLHAIPTMGMITLPLYRAQVMLPAAAQSNYVKSYYAPLVRVLTAGVQNAYLWLTDEVSTNSGSGYNNLLYAAQALGPQYADLDYRLDMDRIRFRNGGFETGTSLSHTNTTHWGGYGASGGISTSIVHGGTRSFVSRDTDGMYQRMVVHPGEEVVLSGWTFTPSATNSWDTNSITGDRYGLVSIEYYTADDDSLIRTDGRVITSSDARDTWKYLSMTSLVPQRAGYGQISVRIVAPTASLVPPGSVYFDDIGVAISADNDRDAIPDHWELARSAILSSNVAADAAQDPDTDGLVNVDEYRAGTDPMNLDTDGDGLSDLYEVNAGLDPLDNYDAITDADFDGLTGAQEAQYGTNPHAQDSDGDGLDDATEAMDYPTDPLDDDFTSFDVVQEIAGTASIARTGAWLAETNGLCADSLRGSVTYSFSVLTADVYRVELEASDCDSWALERSYALRILLNDLYLGRQMLFTETNGVGQAGLFTPWLTNGSYSVRFEWDNASASRLLNVRKFRLMRLSGVDANADGMKDWVSNRMGRISGLDTIIFTSSVSPACLEGRDPYPSLMSISGGATSRPGIFGRWYANVGVDASSTVSRTVSFQNSVSVQTAQLVWGRTDLLASLGQMSVRTGNAVRFTAHPDGATSGTFAITIAGVTNYSLPVGQSAVHYFNATGSFHVAGTNYPVVGSPQSGNMTVTVVAASFETSPAVWAGVERRWECPGVPTSIVVQGGQDIRLTSTNAVTGRAFNLYTELPEEHGIIARVGGTNGPIAVSILARGFRFASASDTKFEKLGVCATGAALFENPWVLSPLLSDLTLEGDIIIGGVLYDDGTVFKTWTATNFDAVGVMNVRFIRDGQTLGALCNTVEIYQGTNLVGRHVSP